jgi:hypothetical protein
MVLGMEISFASEGRLGHSGSVTEVRADRSDGVDGK